MTITIIILAALLSTLLCLYIISIIVKEPFVKFLKILYGYIKGNEYQEMLVHVQIVLLIIMFFGFLITYCVINNTFLHFKY